MIRAFAIAIGVALVVGVPGVAAAKPRVAIIAFDDDAAGEMQDTVAELLDGEFAIVGPRQTTRQMDKLGFDSDLTSKQLKKLARELDAEAVIRGDLKKKNGHKILHLRLFVNGKKVHGFRIEFVSPRSAKFKEALKDKLVEKLGGTSGGGDSGGGDDGEKPPKDKKKEPKEDGGGGDGETTAGGDDGDKKKKKQEPDDEGDDGGKKKKKRTAKTEDDEDEPAEGEGEDGPPKPASPHTINRAAVRVDFGASLSKRQLTFTSRNFEEAPNPYANNPVPGGRVEAEIYPLAFGNPNSVASGLGIGGDFDQTISLNLQSTVQPGTKFPVKQSHWSVGGRLRFVFGRSVRAPSVTLKGGYATRSFKVDRGKLMQGNVIDLPDVGYKGFTGGLDLRVPIAGPVALFAGGNAVFVTTTGAIQTRAQYGQAKVTGAEARAGFDIAIGKRMAIKAFGEFAQMGFAFTGTGEMSNNRDGDPATKDVGGAADRYIGGSLLFGVLY